ncbi:MAG: hypothetical protein WAQ33_03795 [Gaiellaceae bacterium]
MEDIATLAFDDVETGDEALAVVRAEPGAVALALSLRSDGDVEVVMTAETCAELVTRVVQGQFVARPQDPNMAVAYDVAQGLGPAPPLPESMADVDTRARFVSDVNRLFAGEIVPMEPVAFLRNAAVAIGQSIQAFVELSEGRIPDVPDPIERLNITLRLWSGCLMAAKTIAEETRAGANTEQIRRDGFVSIDEVARADRVFEAGVEGAPVFKRNAGETYSLEGVPKDSPVLRYAV